MNLRQTAVCWALLLVSACAKKEAKPMRTEPWLAHPPASASASASASADAGAPVTDFLLTRQSLLRFEQLPHVRNAVKGTIASLSGELQIDLHDLSRVRGHVRADFRRLTLGEVPTDADGDSGADAGASSALLERLREALGRDSASVSSRYEITAVEDASLSQLEPAPPGDAPFVRKARGTAIGDLLLHGFRVSRRVPFDAEFGFGSDRQVPTTVVIRSRAPLVISLETHAVSIMGPEIRPHAGPAAVREVAVTVELYAKRAP